MNAAAAPTAATAGINPLAALRFLRLAGPALAGQAMLQGQLAHLEWELEKARLLRMLLIILLGYACLLGILFFSGAWLLAAAWNTAYRMHAFASLILACSFGAAMAWRRFQAESALGVQAFADSREELAADVRLLSAGL